MSVQEIASAIKCSHSSLYQSQLARWGVDVPAFLVFMDVNKAKLRSKFISVNTDEDVKDVLAELNVARRFLAQPDYQVIYEPLGTDDTRSPDLRITNPAFSDFNVEVKRIRESPATIKYDACIADITAAYCEVDSPLKVSIEYIGRLDTEINLPNRLASAMPKIKRYVVSQVVHYASVLSSGQKAVDKLPGFERELQVEFRYVPGKDPLTPTKHDFGIIEPLLFTQRESFKFSDIVCNALGQLQAGMANVLAVMCDSSTHEPEEVRDALREMQERSDSGDDEFFQGKKLSGAKDYKGQLRKLSAVVVFSRWFSVTEKRPPNYVRHNPQATCLLSQELLTTLAVM